MIKKEKDKLNTFFTNHISNIRHVTWLTNFKIGFSQNHKDDSDFKGNRPARMTIDTDYRYLTAILRYNEHWVKDMWKGRKYDEIIDVLCHEVAHILTGESFDKLKIKNKGDGEYYQERLTEHVGRLIGWKYYNWMWDEKINKRTGK